MSGQNEDHPLTGRRFELIAMGPDPDPIPAGSRGTVDSAVDFHDETHLNVTWDRGVGRSLNLVLPTDKVRWLDERE